MDLTVKDAAKMLNATEDQVFAWIRSGTLPSHRVKDRCRLNRVELLEWAAARNIQVAPEFFRDQHAAVDALLLAESLTRGGILYDVACSDKTSALDAVCKLLKLPADVDRDELRQVLLAREDLCSTGIGGGVAIPHPRSPILVGLSDPQVAMAFLRQPVEYRSIDGRPVGVLFVIISTTVHIHLKLLGHLMFVLQDAEFRELLHQRAAESVILDKVAEIERRIGQPATPGENAK